MQETLMKSLGFDDREASTFLLLAKLGPSPASTLARLGKINRSSMYGVLENLLERTLISSYKKHGVQYFYIDDVNKLVLEENRKLELSKQLVQELKKACLSETKAHISYYKGVEGFRQMYADILEVNPKELLGWMDLDYFYEHLEADYDEMWIAERTAKGVPARLILKESPLAQELKQKDPLCNREVRFIPKPHYFFASCFLYNDYIAFFDPTEEVVGIRIHSRAMAAMQRAIFEMNWAALGAPVCIA
jgi:sugar-specific transcriptional regulator TrmB